jgi:hypothetical protein
VFPFAADLCITLIFFLFKLFFSLLGKTLSFVCFYIFLINLSLNSLHYKSVFIIFEHIKCAHLAREIFPGTFWPVSLKPDYSSPCCTCRCCVGIFFHHLDDSLSFSYKNSCSLVPVFLPLA